MGGTIALRVSGAHPDRIACTVLIGIEDIEDDGATAAETALMNEFADRVQAYGIEAGWDLFLPNLQPLIATLVRDAIPRSDRASSRPPRPLVAIAHSAQQPKWRLSRPRF